MNEEDLGFVSEALLDSLDIAVIVFDRDGRIVQANQRARDGFSLFSQVLMDRVDATSAADLQLMDAVGALIDIDELPWMRTMASGDPVDAFVMGVRSEHNRSTAWVSVTSRPRVDDDGKAIGAICTFFNITAERETQAALRASEERFRVLAESAADVVYRFTVGESPRFDYVNPAVEPALGYTPAEFYEDPGLVVRVTHDDDVAEVRDLGAEGVEGVRSVQLRMMRRDGTMIWTEHRVVPLRDADGNVTAVSGIARDVTALKVKEAYLSHRALHDPLTGLPNRVLLLDRLESALARIRRHQGVLAVCYLDLDRFKTVNDNLGHDVGDRLLQAVSRRLQETLRPSDSVARLGGDEFAAVLPDLNGPEEAHQVAERLLAAVAEPVDLGEGELVTTVSIGIATADDGEASAGELLRRADFAMYSAKDRGRAQVAAYAAPSADDGEAPDR
jgi:diguanylate cyclase (GGDEF)-like protein/PAS domain S-box-containing protein